MKKTLLFLVVIGLLFGCQSKNETQNQNEESNQNQETVEDDDVGDDENKSYALGKITFSAEGQTVSITDFGLDPYTVLTWFTPESGIDAVAAVVFKSSDFKKSFLFTMKEFDTMQTDFSGEKSIQNGMPNFTFSSGDNNYTFSEGTVSIADFSRKTGHVKLKVSGKCNKVVMFNPSDMKTDLEATLEVDALMPYASIDGVATITESAKKINIKKPF